jgi:hypothetical protein
MYSDEQLKMFYVMLVVAAVLNIALATFTVATWLYFKGRNYYKCGSFSCPVEEYVEAEGWGE